MIHGHSCVIVDSVKAPISFLDHPEHICRRYTLRGNTVQGQRFSKHRIHCSVWFHFKILASKQCKQQIIQKTIHSDCHTQKTVYTQQIICIHPANITHSKQPSCFNCVGETPHQKKTEPQVVSQAHFPFNSVTDIRFWNISIDRNSQICKQRNCSKPALLKRSEFGYTRE